jgi:hypothetical protein
MEDKLYLIDVEGGIEPTVRGPYETEEKQDAEARRIRREDQGDDDVLFWARVSVNGELEVGAYSGGFFSNGGDAERRTEGHDERRTSQGERYPG